MKEQARDVTGFCKVEFLKNGGATVTMFVADDVAREHKVALKMLNGDEGTVRLHVPGQELTAPLVNAEALVRGLMEIATQAGALANMIPQEVEEPGVEVLTPDNAPPADDPSLPFGG